MTGMVGTLRQNAAGFIWVDSSTGRVGEIAIYQDAPGSPYPPIPFGLDWAPE